jgi:hypothetical protein
MKALGGAFTYRRPAVIEGRRALPAIRAALRAYDEALRRRKAGGSGGIDAPRGKQAAVPSIPSRMRERKARLTRVSDALRFMIAAPTTMRAGLPESKAGLRRIEASPTEVPPCRRGQPRRRPSQPWGPRAQDASIGEGRDGIRACKSAGMFEKDDVRARAAPGACRSVPDAGRSPAS